MFRLARFKFTKENIPTLCDKLLLILFHIASCTQYHDTLHLKLPTKILQWYSLVLVLLTWFNEPTVLSLYIKLCSITEKIQALACFKRTAQIIAIWKHLLIILNLLSFQGDTLYGRDVPIIKMLKRQMRNFLEGNNATVTLVFYSTQAVYVRWFRLAPKLNMRLAEVPNMLPIEGKNIPFSTFISTHSATSTASVYKE